jgi:outer membrane protein
VSRSPRRRWIHGGLLVASLALVAPAHAQTKVAVIDMQRAVMQTEEGMRAQATLKRMFDSRQRDLDRRQKSLVQERKHLERQARVLSRAAFQRRMEHWQRRMVEVQTKFVDYNKELAKKQSELTDPVIRKLFRTIKRLATRRGFDVVVDKTAVPYARTDLDLTDKVVQMYNSGDSGGGDKGGDGDSKKEAAPKGE